MDSLPDNAFHRAVDLLVLDADKRGACRSYIIFPGTVWGQANGLLFDKGISNTFSQQIPGMIRWAIERGNPGYVGKGQWSRLHHTAS